MKDENCIIVSPMQLPDNINEIIKNSQAEFECGYKSHFMIVNYKVNEFDNSIKFLSFVTNNKNEVVVPLRIIITGNDNKDIAAIFKSHVLKNDKALYTDENNISYIINLKEVRFDKRCTPTNYIIRFNAYFYINDSKIIIYVDNLWYLYDIIKEKVMPFSFDELRYDPENNKLYGIRNIVHFNKTINICFIINKDGSISNEVFVNNIEFFMPLDKTSNIDNALEYLLESYFSMNNGSYNIGTLH